MAGAVTMAGLGGIGRGRPKDRSAARYVEDSESVFELSTSGHVVRRIPDRDPRRGGVRPNRRELRLLVQFGSFPDDSPRSVHPAPVRDHLRSSWEASSPFISRRRTAKSFACRNSSASSTFLRSTSACACGRGGASPTPSSSPPSDPRRERGRREFRPTPWRARAPQNEPPMLGGTPFVAGRCRFPRGYRSRGVPAARLFRRFGGLCRVRPVRRRYRRYPIG